MEDWGTSNQALKSMLQKAVTEEGREWDRTKYFTVTGSDAFSIQYVQRNIDASKYFTRYFM